MQNIKKIFFVVLCFYTLFILIPFFILHSSKIFSTEEIPTSDFRHTIIHTSDLITTLFFISIAFTFILGGILISLLFRYYVSGIMNKKISFYYSINLIGSAFGAFFSVILLELYGTFDTLLLTYLFSVIAVILYGFYIDLNKKYILLLFALLIPLIFSSYIRPFVQILCLPEKPLLFSMSNSFSQIEAYNMTGTTVISDDETDSGYNTNALSNFTVYDLKHDCVADISVINYTTYDYPDFLSHYITYIPFKFGNYPTVLIIGSGGANEVAQAISSGSKKITAVEINTLVIEAVNKLSYANPYKYNSTELVLQEGRSFITKTSEKYDLIEIPTTKNFGAIGLNAYALSENYLYTKEAFNQYLNHLNDGGVLSLTEYNAYIYPYIETLQNTLNDRNGTKEVMLIKGNEISTALYKNDGFSEIQKSKILNESKNMGFNAYIIAENKEYSDFNSITDDKPFVLGAFGFIGMLSGNVKGQLKTDVKSLDLINSLNKTLYQDFYVFIIFLSTLYISLILIPTWFKKSKFTKSVPYIIGFFSCIGIAFIIVELILVDKMTLLLGHPIYSLSIVLSSILLFGGIGSLFTNKFKSKEIIWSIRIAILLVAVLSIYFLTIDQIIHGFQGAEFLPRIILSIALLFLPSFLMGMLFPMGLTFVKNIDEKLIPWMFGIDGITTVMGAVFSQLISLFFGFRTSLLIGILFYGISLYFLIKLKEKK